ncbi:MAG: ester cyclase [Ignavibacteriaceae bacterium]|nr:ester cyclase [Ignavibacteriaceae bacterium]
MKNLFLLFLAVSFLVISACEEKVDITSENKAIFNRVGMLWNTGDLAKIDDIFATDFVNHDPNAPDVNDLEGYKGLIVMTRTGIPDFHVTSEDIIAEGDKVVCRWTASGTHKGELFGIPPTGKKATWKGISIYRFADGKIIEAWWSKDMFSLLQQLGAIPPPGKDGD